MSDQSWSDYRLAAFGEPYMVWHDGPDFNYFRATAQADPVTAERVLREGLEEGDALAAQAIAVADFSDEIKARFIPVLTTALQRDKTSFRVRVAQTLTQLTGEQQWAAAIVDVLAQGPFWGHRLDAAMALASYQPTVELIAALMRAMSDADYLVRYHASNTLLRYSGSTKDVSDDAELFAQIAGDSTPETRLLAAATLGGAAGTAMRS